MRRWIASGVAFLVVTALIAPVVFVPITTTPTAVDPGIEGTELLAGLTQDGPVPAAAADEPSTSMAVLQSEDYHGLAISAANAGGESVAYYGHNNGVMRSKDGGKTWEPLLDRPDFVAIGVAVNPSDPHQVYLAGPDILQLSIDGGSTFQPIAHNLPNGDVYGFAMSPDDPGRLYAFILREGVFRSDDAGATWEKLAGQVPGDVVALAAAGGDSETLFASSLLLGVVRTTDGGETWAPAQAGMDTRGILTIAVDPSAHGTVYAGGDGLFKTTDGGNTWARLAYPVDNVIALAVDPAHPGVLLAISLNESDQGIVFRSEDGGSNWMRQ